MARQQLPGYGFPHVILPYPPKEELTCIGALRNLPAKLTAQGVDSQLIPIAPLVAEVVHRVSRRALRDANDYRLVQGDLSEPKGGVVGDLVQLFVERYKDASGLGRVFILCRLGALYPFAHVSGVLEGLYSKGIRTTLAVAYPGKADGTSLSFLGRLDPTGAYRGHIVT
jgi:hypothetical protein